MANDPPLGPPSEVLDEIKDTSDMIPIVNNLVTCRRNVGWLRFAFGACDAEQKAADKAVAKAQKSEQIVQDRFQPTKLSNFTP